MVWVVVALLYFVLAAVAPSILGLFVNRARPDFPTLSLSLRALFVVIALICLAATSYVHVESDEIAVLSKIYGTTSLPGEHIIATNGEKGPQADILTPGWHPWFLVNVIYQVENKKVVSIPSGKYGFLNAKDGAPLRPDQFLADAFPAEHQLDMLDAEYFLTHGGQRGPQTTILTLGNKGAYKRRYIELSLDQAGNLTQPQRSQDVPVPPGSAAPAFSPFVEGWLVPLELRVPAQVPPDNAPSVVAAVGGLPEIENNI